MTKKNDGLFLLEVLIDKIVFVKSPCFSDKDFRTCVNIQCPGVEPLEICDDETGSCIAKSTGPFIKSFNNGKSCLFSLTESDISTAMTKYPIKVLVYKSLPCGCLPTKINMGECEIDLTKEFVEARKTFLEDPTNVSYQALKDSFRIVGADGTETGEIVMFLRISCFGKLIITKFQGPGSPQNLDAGRSSAIVDRSCTPNKAFQSIQDPCACGAARGMIGGKNLAGQPCNDKGGNGVCPPARDPYNSMPCEDPDDPCYCSGPKAQVKDQMVCRNTDQYCLHVPK
ncbi:jg9827, partial [Pararge aegeria aegeria]